MPETAARKKPATAATTAKNARTAPPKKAGAASASKKQKPKVDPYDDPFAPIPKKPAAKKKTAAKKKPAVQENPLGRMAEIRDPYDDPWAPPAKQSPRKAASKQPRKSPTRAKPASVRDDPFADLPPRKPKKSKSSNGGKRGKKRSGSFLTFLLTTLIVLASLLIALQLYRYAEFIKMRNAVSGSDFFAGTTIDGVDVSGMTLESAIAHWETNIEPAYSGRTVTLDNGTTITAAELGYSSDYKTIIAEAWRAQSNGSLRDRYSAYKNAASGKNGLHVTRIPYTDDAITARADSIAAATDVPMKEPAITGFDHDALAFTFSEGAEGRIVDRAKLVSDIKNALDNGGGGVTLSISTTSPTTTVADMQSLYGLRAYAVTNASSSNSNRLTNIKLALASINGTLLQPGEEFSFNKVVGKRTSERGYKVATAYNAGEVTEELGGGICQVSTTLFNAVVKSDLSVTERRNHSIPVSYVDKGKDAAVSWGAQDLKFTNNSDEPVYIVAYLDGDKRVRIGVFGRLIENGEYITVEAKITYSKNYETKYQYNAFLLPGDTVEVQSGRNTYEAVAYKLRWSAEGELLEKETLCESSYYGRDAIIEYGP